MSVCSSAVVWYPVILNLFLLFSQSEIPDDLRPLAEHESDEQQRGADDALPPDAQLAPDGGNGRGKRGQVHLHSGKLPCLSLVTITVQIHHLTIIKIEYFAWACEIGVIL